MLNATTRYTSVEALDRYRRVVRNWRRSPPIAVAVVALILIVQLAIPISRLGDETARRFGWQMFSSSVAVPKFSVATAEGEFEVELSRYMARIRADIDIVTLIPPHLCATVPGAQRVTWADSEYTC